MLFYTPSRTHDAIDGFAQNGKSEKGEKDIKGWQWAKGGNGTKWVTKAGRGDNAKDGPPSVADGLLQPVYSHAYHVLGTAAVSDIADNHVAVGHGVTQLFRGRSVGVARTAQ